MRVGKRGWGRAFDVVLLLLVVDALLRTGRTAWTDGYDFSVFWGAAHAWLIEHASPYLDHGSLAGFYFKYPPWVIPVLAPLGLLPYRAAKVVWGVLEWASLAACFAWLRGEGVARRTALAAMLAFWWTLLAHFQAGQITLLMLAAALWLWPSRPAGLALALSTKVFSAVSMAGLGARELGVRFWARAFGLFAALDVLAWLPLGLGPAHLGFVDFHAQCVRAMTSGGAELTENIRWSFKNYGFTAAILRNLSVPSTQTQWDVGVALCVALVLGLAWYRWSKSLTPGERWAGWLAIGLVSHPLAWQHSFVMAMPLCALAAHRAIASRSRGALGTFVVGAFFAVDFVPKLFGAATVAPFERFGSRSWGVVLVAAALVWAARTQALRLNSRSAKALLLNLRSAKALRPPSPNPGRLPRKSR